MNKNFWKLVIGIIIITSLLVGGLAFAENNITVQLDGKTLNFDVQPQLIGGRTMVPLRTIFESLGATVDWNNDTQTVTAFNELYYVQATINDNKMKINGETRTLDVPPLLVDGRTLVSARFVAEAFGAKVDWDGGNNKVVITTNDASTTFSVGEYVCEVSSTWKQVEGSNGITYFYPSGTNSSENGLLMVQTEYMKVDNASLGGLYDAFIEGIKGSVTNFRILEQSHTIVANIEGRKMYFSGNMDDNVYQFEVVFFIQNDMFYNFMFAHQDNIPSSLTNDFNKVIKSISIVNSDTPNVVVPKVAEIKSAIELEKYLKDNFGELKTEFITFDLKNYIRVIENENKFKCYDIAIVIPWSTIENEYYNIRNSIKYTDEQIKAFEDSINSYLKSMANAAISAMPTKKIRGGFLESGYKYPNLKMDYYENTIFGWKNYDYLTRIFPYYEDTKVTEFHWHIFSHSGAPLDEI